MLRWIVRALAILVIAVAALVVLDFAELLVPVEPDDSASMATTIPACDGRVLAQGVSYRFERPEPRRRRRRPRCRHGGGRGRPRRGRRRPHARAPRGRQAQERRSSDARERFSWTTSSSTTSRRRRSRRSPSPTSSTSSSATTASAAIDSRTFGPVLGDAIFAKVFAVWWPLRDLTFRLGPVRRRAARHRSTAT